MTLTNETWRFRAGAVVRLASGSPPMTVEVVEGDTAVCAWLVNGTLQRASIAKSALVMDVVFNV